MSSSWEGPFSKLVCTKLGFKEGIEVINFVNLETFSDFCFKFKKGKKQNKLVVFNYREGDRSLSIKEFFQTIYGYFSQDRHRYIYLINRHIHLDFFYVEKAFPLPRGNRFSVRISDYVPRKQVLSLSLKFINESFKIGNLSNGLVRFECSDGMTKSHLLSVLKLKSLRSVKLIRVKATEGLFDNQEVIESLKRVNTLHINSVLTRGQFSSIFGEFENLTDIGINGDCAIPDDLRVSSCVRKLKVEDSFNRNITHFQNVEVLDMNNVREGLNIINLVYAVSQLPKLKVISADFGIFTDDSNELSEMEDNFTVERISLKGCRLSKAIFKFLGKLRGLKKLNIIHYKTTNRDDILIGVSEMEVLVDLPELTDLALKLQEDRKDVIEKMLMIRKMRSLSITSFGRFAVSKYFRLILESFASTLKQFSFCSSVTDEMVEFLKDVSLDELVFYHCVVSQEQIEKVKNECNGVKYVDFHYCIVKGVGHYSETVIKEI